MTDKLNILSISYLFPNAAHPNHGIFVYNRLNALSQYINIKVINPIPWSPIHALHPNYKHLSQIPLKTQRGNLEIFHPRYLSIPKYFKGIESLTYKKAVFKTIERYLQDYQFDLIDLHWTFPDLPTGSALSKSFNRPFTATLRGMEAFHLQDTDIRAHLVATHLKQADLIIALSEELAETSKRLGADKTQHHIVRNGVDTDQFHFISQHSAREKLGLPTDEKIILMVGSLIERKGFDIVIEALPQIMRLTNSNLKLYIVGSQGAEGDFRQQLYSQIDRLKLKDQVILQGSVQNQELNYWYNAADVFCLASRGEGSPNVLTEALATGCPSVATDVGSVREILDSEEGLGPCVPVGDVDKMGQALTTMLQTKVNREKHSLRFSKYNWDWCAQQVLHAFESLNIAPRRNL